MDMKEQTRNSVLTAMVCIALSSGTAWAAVPEEPVPVVQQKSLTGTVSDQAAELRSMPLYWSALKPKEEQVKKAQPVIITAEDIEAKRKEEKRAAAAQAAKGAQKKPAAESNVQPQPVAAPKPAEAAHVQPVNGTPAQAQPVKPASSVPVQAQAAPMTDIAPAQAQPAKPAIGVPPQPQQPATPPAQPAVPASKPQSQTPEAKPQVAAPVSKPQAQPVPQHENKTPPQPALPPASPQEPVLAVTPKRQMVQIHPEGLYASRRQDPVAGQVPQEQKHPAYRDEGYEKSQAQPQQPERTVQQPLPKQIQVERPPEFEGISDEVVRHIMAGEYAMRYQLSRDASEPGVYRLTQVLNRNTGLSHLQKIEYLMGFGRAINRSKLSEYQKKALIDAVIQSFGEK